MNKYKSPIVDLKPVKRCPKCGHLIPEGQQICPYCEGSYELKRPTYRPVNQSAAEGNESQGAMAPKFTMPKLPPLTPENKKKLGIAAIAVAGIAVLAFLAVFLSSLFRLNQSIMEPMEPEKVAKIEKDTPGFSEKYMMIERMREAAAELNMSEKFKEISYGQMVDFLDHYSSYEYCAELTDPLLQTYEKEFHAPIAAKVEETKNKWSEYLEVHNPDNYLVITGHERYQTGSNYYSTIYYPGFYFDLSYPKGPISDCNFTYGLKNRNSGNWGTNAKENGNLNKLKELNSAQQYYWRYYSSYSKDIYNSWRLATEIHSVTLTDGTVIRRSDLNNVPAEAMKYLNNPDEDTEYEMIRALIDSNYPNKRQYVSDNIAKSLKAEDANCYKLAEITNLSNAYEAVTRGWQYIEPQNEEDEELAQLRLSKNGHYEGQGYIDGNLKITMDLDFNGNKITGSYYYRNNSRNRLTLEGYWVDNQNFILNEYNKSGRCTGTFNARRTTKTPIPCEGTFTATSNGKELSFYLNER